MGRNEGLRGGASLVVPLAFRNIRPIIEGHGIFTIPRIRDPMNRSSRRMGAGSLVAALAISACSPAAGHAPTTPAPAPVSAATVPRSRDALMADSLRRAFVPADVHFMTGMIGHHGQALVMARWIPSHGSSPALRALGERIIVGQSDEITLMQNWLRDRNLPVPSPDAPMNMSMPGMNHPMLMPGMLTPEQMAQLDAARGSAFDRLFLTFMIQHHTGALTMVNELFGTEGAGQDEPVFRLASDVYADQSTEIDRMQKLLATLPGGGSAP